MPNVVIGGGAEKVKRCAITSGQTIKNDDFVILTSDGTVSPAAATSAAIYGRAKLDYTTGYVLVTLAYPDQWYQVKASGTVAETNVGETHDISLEAVTNIHLCNLSGTTYNVLKIQQIIDATTKQIFVSVPPAVSQAVSVSV